MPRMISRGRRRSGPVGGVALILMLAGAAVAPAAVPSVAAASPSAAPSWWVRPVWAPPPAWQSMPDSPLGRPYAFAGVWTGGELLVAGRAANPGGDGSNVAAAYRPATHSWRRLPAPPAFTGTYPSQVRAAWTGREMLVWGSGMGAAFDPAANRWRRLPAVGSGPDPTGPGGDVVVWTGHQMLVWGATCCGRSGGAAYDPVADSWRALPPSPLAVRSAFGTWTGRELVLAGGTDAHGRVYSDAAAYDPATRSWRRLAPMPAPRAFASAVWDGAEVLVVGGQGPAAGHGPTRPYRDALRYDPTADRWRVLPATGPGRVAQAAVWTGRRLLVWGGRTVRNGTEASPTDGLAFEPRHGRWVRLPVAPLAARTDPVAVWTGTSLLVWGGRSVPLGDILPDGASYTP